jgi:hypothetical protein
VPAWCSTLGNPVLGIDHASIDVRLYAQPVDSGRQQRGRAALGQIHESYAVLGPVGPAEHQQYWPQYARHGRGLWGGKQ